MAQHVTQLAAQLFGSLVNCESSLLYRCCSAAPSWQCDLFDELLKKDSPVGTAAPDNNNRGGMDVNRTIIGKQNSTMQYIITCNGGSRRPALKFRVITLTNVRHSPPASVMPPILMTKNHAGQSKGRARIECMRRSAQFRAFV